ncbi:SHOCT domain-containing protein [Rathayibacter sp. AY1E6]|uniref:SHOCT domain-containing protein n=1 Tax=Rathayibacter sp. AY1E6 TaxID=2080554 RepID=UPI0011B07A18|nr:SHOCT domain-containing protein [Rathayibacter sp. AY1E6]
MRIAPPVRRSARRWRTDPEEEHRDAVPADTVVPPWYSIAFIAVPIVIAVVIVLVVVLIVVNVHRARSLGVDPLTLRTEVAARFAREGPGSARPLADRLAELEALRAAGTITEAEYAQARRAALGGG